MEINNHAIVVGGGIAGLVAARVLANHFERVTLVERDRYPKEPVFRPGVPQGRQVHTMMLRGQRALESLFPGLAAKLFAQGAIQQIYGHKSIYVYKQKRCLPLPPVLQGWNCSRLLLEWQIRQELMHFDQIEVLEGFEVTQLLLDSASNTVHGVQLRQRRSEVADTLQELKGSLVVDASGATSKTVEWLQQRGYEAPQESVIDAHIGYATQVYEQPANFHEDWTGIAIQPMDRTRRGGVLMRVEGQRWMVVLTGTDEDMPSIKEEEYLAFAKRLPDPVLYDAIKSAKALSPIYGYRRTENRLRHFERLKRFPENFVIIGDAICTLNPVYGQGMTVAVLEALTLDRCLKQYKRQNGFARTFQRQVARLIRVPWFFVATGDAPKKEKPSLAGRYMDRLFDLLATDGDVLLTFIEVMQMLRSPLALIQPKILIKVLTSKKAKH